MEFTTYNFQEIWFISIVFSHQFYMLKLEWRQFIQNVFKQTNKIIICGTGKDTSTLKHTSKV